MTPEQQQAIAELRSFLDLIWEEDEMGYVIDPATESREQECGKCGAIEPKQEHAADCLQGKIIKCRNHITTLEVVQRERDEARATCHELTTCDDSLRLDETVAKLTKERDELQAAVVAQAIKYDAYIDELQAKLAAGSKAIDELSRMYQTSEEKRSRFEQKCDGLEAKTAELTLALQDAINLFNEADQALDSKSTICTAERREAWKQAIEGVGKRVTELESKLAKSEAALQKSNGLLQMAIDAGAASEAAGAQWQDWCSAANANLAKALAEGAEMREVLLAWKAYNQADVPKNADENEAAGEQFTDVWFKNERALSSTCGTAFLDRMERMRKALGFYADANNWARRFHGPSSTSLPCLVFEDSGNLAREALKEAQP